MQWVIFLITVELQIRVSFLSITRALSPVRVGSYSKLPCLKSHMLAQFFHYTFKRELGTKNFIYPTILAELRTPFMQICTLFHPHLGIGESQAFLKLSK